MTKVDGISEIETDTAALNVKFKAAAGVDVDSHLNELAKTNEHLKDWSKN